MWVLGLALFVVGLGIGALALLGKPDRQTKKETRDDSRSHD